MLSFGAHRARYATAVYIICEALEDQPACKCVTKVPGSSGASDGRKKECQCSLEHVV